MFNFWSFNVARKRREAEREKRIAQLVEDMDRPQPKRNKVIPMGDPRHPRNLSPQQRADRIAAMRPELGMPYASSKVVLGTIVPRHVGPAPAPVVLNWEERESFSDERRMEPAPAEAVALVQQFRCAHPAISEFWQEQQARCDSPTDTSSPSCDAPPSND